MKFIRMILFINILFCGSNALAQEEPERLNLPGDNLNLYAVMKLFQESPTLEGFERKLNDSSSKVNNLDLNEDNKIDYIRVVDHPEGEIHNITLKVAINKNEDQDVAVFVVQKMADDKVQIQLIGDEDLYGKDYIIEPNMNDDETTAGETANPGYSNNAILANGEPVDVQQTTSTQIASWPVVTYIYVPTYTVWNSPWYWDYYPSYWQPWEPYYWHYYYGYHFHWEHYYYGHYHHYPRYRVAGWKDHYYGSHFHSVSPYVRDRSRQGAYNRTYSRPQLARTGSDQFKTDNPRSPYVKSNLPTFDQAGTPVRKPQIITPVKQQPTRPPVKDEPITPTKDHPVKPVEQQPVRPPVKDEPITPTKDQPVKPVEQQPVRPPVKDEPITPTKDQPVKPVEQQPVRPPVKHEPITPTQDQPVRPPRQQPTRPPVRHESATPGRDVPTRREPTRHVSRPVTRTKSTVTKPIKLAKTEKKAENNK